MSSYSSYSSDLKKASMEEENRIKVFKEVFSTNLRLARENAGLTLECVAYSLDVSLQTVKRWEKGTYLPNPFILYRLACLYEVSISTLFCGVASEKQLDEICAKASAQAKGIINKSPKNPIPKSKPFSEETFYTEFGQRLASCRKKACMTQEDAIGLLEVSSTTISGWELGKKAPQLHRLPLIAETYTTNACNPSLDDFFPPVEVRNPDTIAINDCILALKKFL